MNVHLFLWAALALSTLLVWTLSKQPNRAKTTTTVFLLLIGALVEARLCRAYIPLSYQQAISLGYPLALVALIVTFQRLHARVPK
jgi:hypothetical protein